MGRVGVSFMCRPIGMSDDAELIWGMSGMFIEPFIAFIATRCCATSHVLLHGTGFVAACDDDVTAPQTQIAAAMDAIEMTTRFITFSIPAPPSNYTNPRARTVKGP
jgi:hypothetical protein